MQGGLTSHSQIVQANHLPPANVTSMEGDTFNEAQTRVSEQIEQVEVWRRSKDALYRILTSAEPRELNEFVLGLISSGQNGAKVGLLRAKYYQHMDACCKRVMDVIEQDIIASDLSINTAAHRVVCHCLLLVATTTEADFLSYIMLHTHNREALRYYLNHVLRHELTRMLQGGFDRSNLGTNVYKPFTKDDFPALMDTENSLDAIPFEVESFVNNSRHMYAVYCTPRKDTLHQ